MSNPAFKLVPVVDQLEPLTTAVLYAKEARAYLRISLQKFQALTKSGVLKRYTHVDGDRPFYLKHDLDVYLRSCPEYKIGPARVFPKLRKESHE